MNNPNRRAASVVLLVAVGTATATLTAFWPRTTQAEEVDDWERQGESDADGMKFGNIVIKGELVADQAAPGGWALVRTLENKGDAPESCIVEERLMREQVAPQARVESRPTALIIRSQPMKLAAHEKRTIGVRLSREIGEQITRARNDQASIEQTQAAAAARENYADPAFGRTYAAFYVEYLKPLPPRATASRYHPTRFGILDGVPDVKPLPVGIVGGDNRPMAPMANPPEPPPFPPVASLDADRHSKQ